MDSLARISSILYTTVDSQLDRADDRQGTLDLLIQDAATALEEARGEIDGLTARTAVLTADRDRSAALARQWEEKATAAMRLGAEHLAFEALGQKIDWERNASAYGKQLTAQSAMVDRLRHDVTLLEERHEGMTRDRGGPMGSPVV